MRTFNRWPDEYPVPSFLSLFFALNATFCFSFFPAARQPTWRCRLLWEVRFFVSNMRVQIRITYLVVWGVCNRKCTHNGNVLTCCHQVQTVPVLFADHAWVPRKRQAGEACNMHHGRFAYDVPKPSGSRSCWFSKETKGGKEGGASLIFSDTITVLETF